MDWQVAQAIDLAGRDVLDAVRTSVYPKVIDCPDPKKSVGTLDAVAGDGIQLKARARVTVRMNLSQLIGGATEETIIARVGEGIVSAIGSCETHTQVLANPMLIARAVLQKGLDSQTAYEIVSIDIADIDVGENIGARLQADQAEADTRKAQALAEKRRADAIAKEQEMKAKVAENRSRLVDALGQPGVARAPEHVLVGLPGDGQVGRDHDDPEQRTVVEEVLRPVPSLGAQPIGQARGELPDEPVRAPVVFVVAGDELEGVGGPDVGLDHLAPRRLAPVGSVAQVPQGQIERRARSGQKLPPSHHVFAA